MKCPQCGFENMPGEARCFQCQAVLEPPPIADVHPPRAPRWSRPLRSAGLWARRLQGRWQAARAGKRVAGAMPTPESIRERAASVDRPPSAPLFTAEMFSAVGRCALGLLLSIVPGLAHAVQRRFGDVRWYVLGWGLALALAIFFYASGPGIACFAVALVLHAWIMVDASVGPFIRKEGFAERIAWRLGFMAGCAIFVVLGYQAVVVRVIPRELVVAQAGVAVPYHRVALRDTLLCMRPARRPGTFIRGDYVALNGMNYYDEGDLYNPGRRAVHRLPDPFQIATAGQLIGFPGEKVELKGDHFCVDGRRLDAERFPVPQWLRGREFSVQLRRNGGGEAGDIGSSAQYFVTLEYQMRAARNVGEAAIRNAMINACIRPPEALVARAYMRWYPVLNRGYLRSAE